MANERGSNAGQANDIAGNIVSKANDKVNNNQDFAKIVASAPVVTSDSESGKLAFQVSTTGGSVEEIVSITGATASTSTTNINGQVTTTKSRWKLDI